MLLGTLFIDYGVDGFLYVCGDRGDHRLGNWSSHAWLQKGDLIVDVTADQFPDAPSAVIVAAPSPWHRNFDVTDTSPSDLRKWQGAGIAQLHALYLRIKGEINE